MNKTKALRIVNPLLALLFLAQAATGLIHDHLSYEFFRLVHRTGGILLILAAVTHLYLNWSWVKANFARR